MKHRYRKLLIAVTFIITESVIKRINRIQSLVIKSFGYTALNLPVVIKLFSGYGNTVALAD